MSAPRSVPVVSGNGRSFAFGAALKRPAVALYHRAARLAACTDALYPAHRTLIRNAYQGGNETGEPAIIFGGFGGLSKEVPMSDFRTDPNFPRYDMNDNDSRVQWAAVAVILLLVGG